MNNFGNLDKPMYWLLYYGDENLHTSDYFTMVYLELRSGLPEVFCEKTFLKISRNSQEIACARVSFLERLQVGDH